MKFFYKARTQEGKTETGTIEASSSEAAAALLQKYGVFVVSLKEQGLKQPLAKKIYFRKGVSKKELAIFFRQVSVMLGSQVPVVQSLNSLADQTKKQNFKEVITKVADMVQEGVPLSEALARHPKFFSPLHVNLIKSGEASGNIAGSLDYISDYVERESDIIAQIRQATIYPAFVISVLFVVLGIVILQIMPRIVELVRDVAKDPPLFTVAMIKFYGFLENYWWLLFTIFILLLGILVFYLRTAQGKKTWHRLSLKIPFLGTLLKKIFLARFCSSVSTLISAGVSINKALGITSNTVNNSVYKKVILELENQVSQGEKMSSVMLQNQEYFPLFIVQMIKVGEQTGKLDKAMLEVVNFYQKDIKRSIDLFASLLEPLMIIFLGIVVAILAISVLMPLYGTLGSF